MQHSKHNKLPQRVIMACEEHIEAETGLKMRLWEKYLRCGEMVDTQDKMLSSPMPALVSVCQSTATV